MSLPPPTPATLHALLPLCRPSGRCTGSGCHYFPEPEKSILVSKPEEEAEAKVRLEKFSFKHKGGCQYLGGFIGSDDAMREWLALQVAAWAEGVALLGRVAHRYPQTAHARLTKSLQSKWQCLQRVMPGIGDEFAGIKLALVDDTCGGHNGGGKIQDVVGDVLMSPMFPNQKEVLPSQLSCKNNP